MGRIFLIVVLLVAAIVFVRHDKLKPIGGHFAVGHSILGSAETKLYYTDPKHRIDRKVDRYRFYAPDCVLYTTERKHKYIYAVCGNRNPVAIAGNEFDFGRYGLERSRAVDSTTDERIRVGYRVRIGKIKSVAIRERDHEFTSDWADNDERNRYLQREQSYREFFDIDSLNDDGKPLLLVGVSTRDLEGVRHLIDLGAHLDVQDEEGITSLMAALVDTSSEARQMVHMLVDEGADLDVQTKTGMTALMIAIRFGAGFEHILLASGADTSLKNKDGLTASQMTRAPGFPR